MRLIAATLAAGVAGTVLAVSLTQSSESVNPVPVTSAPAAVTHTQPALTATEIERENYASGWSTTTRSERKGMCYMFNYQNETMWGIVQDSYDEAGYPPPHRKVFFRFYVSKCLRYV